MPLMTQTIFFYRHHHSSSRHVIICYAACKNNSSSSSSPVRLVKTWRIKIPTEVSTKYESSVYPINSKITINQHSNVIRTRIESAIKWILEQRNQNICVSRKLIQEKALELANKKGLTQSKFDLGLKVYGPKWVYY